MKTLARLEELATLLFSIYLFSRLTYAWWVYPALFFVPDISLFGLVIGKRAGAFTYNLIHHRAVALGAVILGGLLGVPPFSLAGVVLLGHASFDRALGLGLMDETGKTRAAYQPSGNRV